MALLPSLIAVHMNALAETSATEAGPQKSGQQEHRPQLEQIEVIGQAVSLGRALQQQRQSDNVESVVHADGIAQLPDDNAAEALQRLPGLSVERDQGEGRFVRVRGTAPDLNSVTINGALVPAPEADRRAVALDVLPSELVQSMSVVKTLTPDMDANSLGGTIEVESLSAFDHDGAFFTGTVEGQYDDNTGETGPKVSGAVSNLFSIGNGVDNFGVALALSWQDRDFGSDNVETGGAWDFDNGARLEEFEMRDYLINRERLGVGLNLDYRPDTRSEYYLRTLFSEFTDTETRQAAVVAFDDVIAEGETIDMESERELKDRKDTQEITSIVVGGEKILESWTVSGQLGFSEASENTPYHIGSGVFASDDVFADSSFRDTRTPYPVTSDAFFEPGSYLMDSVEMEQQTAKDQVNTARLDFLKDYVLGGYDNQLKFGAKASRREKTNDLDIVVYEDFGDAGFTDDQLNLSQFSSGNVDYALGRFGPAIHSAAVQQFLLGAEGETDEEASRLEDYTIEENINAAYVMNSIDIDRWRLMFGVRYEGTEQSAQGTEYNADLDQFSPVQAENDYDHWLPGLHARYQLNDDTQVRMAWTNVVVRPTFEQIRPGILIDGADYDAGNPYLKPLEASNLDVGLEHYLGSSGVLSVFLFYKDIEHFIYETDVAGAPGYTAYDEAITYANGDDAELFGAELAWSQKLDQLSGWMSGVILGANLTLTHSDATISGYVNGIEQTRAIELPSQSDTVGNVMLGWENERVSVRVAANYKSEYLDEVSGFENDQFDVMADSQTFVDITASYFVTKQLQIRFEALNVTDEAYYTWVNSSRYNAQYEEYGPTYKLGLTLSQF